MSTGIRFFLIEGDEIQKISQKKFDSFFSRREKSLPEYAGESITVATAVCELVDLKPFRIVSLSCLKLRVNADGSMDEGNLMDGIKLKLDAPAQSKISRVGQVIKAKQLFDSRRIKQSNPELSGPAHKKILKALFG